MKAQGRRDEATKGRRVALIALVVALTVGGAQASEEREARRKAEQATAALNAGEHQRALDGYREAEVMFPNSPELAFNQGVVHYRLRDFEKARERFGKALSARDLSLEQRAKFNLGNCAYAEALERMSDLQSAVDHLQTAILRYRDALELRPDDQDARANIEMAQLLIKDLLDKLKQQQEQEKQEQNKQEQQDQPQQDQECPQSQPAEDQPAQDDRQQGDKQEKQEQQQQGDQQQQPQEKPSGEGEREEKQAMTPEEAARLLQAVRDRERQRREELRRRIPMRQVRVDRDW